MEITNSWTEVRTAHERANQMAVQTVEAYAAIGDMLKALKATTKHGEFGKKCAEAFSKIHTPCVFSEAEIHAAQISASRYMRLAENRSVWLPHNPQSMNEAMKMLPAKRAAAKPSKVTYIDPHTVDAEPVAKQEKFKSWTQVSLEMGLSKTLSGGSRDSLRDKILKITGLEQIPKPKDMTQEKYDVVINALETIKQEKLIEQQGQSKQNDEVKTLPETVQQKFDRLLKKEFARLQAELNVAVAKYEKEFNERVWNEFKRVNGDWLAERQATADKHTQALMDLQTQRRGITPHITPEDYKFLRQILHPDSAPEGRSEKYSKAFNIITRLDAYIEVVKKAA
jgi:predicted metal-binding transcription factor (methanogenesis marker protein 9)